MHGYQSKVGYFNKTGTLSFPITTVLLLLLLKI